MGHRAALETVCYFCNERIKAGEYRVTYRFKRGSRAADLRKAHVPFCVALLPLETRDRDLRLVHRWQEDASGKDLQWFDELDALLRLPSGAASSGQ